MKNDVAIYEFSINTFLLYSGEPVCDTKHVRGIPRLQYNLKINFLIDDGGSSL